MQTLPRPAVGQSSPGPSGPEAPRVASPAEPVRPTWREAIAAGSLLTVWSLAERGFDGARWSDVPIVKSFVDPRLYRQDPFIWTLHDGTPAAFTYQLIAAVVSAFSWLPFDFALFLIYLPSTIASLALLYLIGLRLTNSR